MDGSFLNHDVHPVANALDGCRQQMLETFVLKSRGGHRQGHWSEARSRNARHRHTSVWPGSNTVTEPNGGYVVILGHTPAMMRSTAQKGATTSIRKRNERCGSVTRSRSMQKSLGREFNAESNILGAQASRPFCTPPPFLNPSKLSRHPLRYRTTTDSTFFSYPRCSGRITH